MSCEIFSALTVCLTSQDVGALSEWEVKVFATVVVEVQAMESKELSAITVSSVDVRGVQLATIFNRAITHFTLVNSVCGEPLDSKLVSGSLNYWFLFHRNHFSSPNFNRTYMLKRNACIGSGTLALQTRHPYLFDGKLFQTLYLAGKAVPSTPQVRKNNYGEIIINNTK